MKLTTRLWSTLDTHSADDSLSLIQTGFHMNNALKNLAFGAIATAATVNFSACSKKNDLIAGQLVTPTAPVKTQIDTVRINEEFTGQSLAMTAGKFTSLKLESATKAKTFIKDANGKTTLEYKANGDLVAAGAAGGQNNATTVTVASNAGTTYVETTSSADGKTVTITTWKHAATNKKLSIIADGITVATAATAAQAGVADLKTSKLTIQ